MPNAAASGAGQAARGAARAAPGASRQASAVVAGVTVTHGSRVVDAATGTTKLDLVRYYDRISRWLLPQLRGRAAALVRAPDGVGGETFFQKHRGRTPLSALRQLDAALWPGRAALLEVHDHTALVSAAQMNVVEFHAWHSTTRCLMRPDRMVFDLDPGDDVAWPDIRDGARAVRDALAMLGLQSWLKTSGGKGLHVVVPLAARCGFATVKAVAKAVVDRIVAAAPDRYVAKSGADNRVGRIFVDYLRNGEGATSVAAYSARARPGLGVSMPITWDELDAVDGPTRWTVANAVEWTLQRAADPWQDIAARRQSLGPVIAALGVRQQPMAGDDG